MSYISIIFLKELFNFSFDQELFNFSFELFLLFQISRSEIETDIQRRSLSISSSAPAGAILDSPSKVVFASFLSEIPESDSDTYSNICIHGKFLYVCT